MLIEPKPSTVSFPELSDEEIVERILGGEALLFEAIMRRYNQRLFRLARSIVRNDEEAEDVIQDAYVRAYTHLDQFAGRAKFSTWLARIALHEALARVRHGRRFASIEDLSQPPEETMSPFSADPPSPERDASSRELQTVLVAAIDALPESLRAVFMLREVEGLSTAETAETLGLSEANVKVRLHRARAALRSGIDRRLGEQTRRVFQFAGARCDRVVATVIARLGLERRG